MLGVLLLSLPQLLGPSHHSSMALSLHRSDIHSEAATLFSLGFTKPLQCANVSWNFSRSNDDTMDYATHAHTWLSISNPHITAAFILPSAHRVPFHGLYLYSKLSITETCAVYATSLQ